MVVEMGFARDMLHTNPKYPYTQALLSKEYCKTDVSVWREIEPDHWVARHEA